MRLIKGLTNQMTIPCTSFDLVCIRFLISWLIDEGRKHKDKEKQFKKENNNDEMPSIR